MSGRDALHIRGVLGTDQLQGGDNMYAGVTVTVAWKNAGSRPAASLTQVVPLAGGLPDPQERTFDVLMPVPSSADSARVNLTMYAGVYKPQQSVYRKIRVYAKDIRVTAMSADDPEAVFLEGAHILDRPHVVTVKDGSGNKLQSTGHRYGRFVHGNNAIIMPDTTSAWLDKDGDGVVDTNEWIHRQVAAAYDAYGNLTQAKDAHGTVTSTIMGYGRMRPVAAFTGADASKGTAEVFDDHAGWDALVAATPWRRTDTRPGAVTVEAGALTLDNAVAERSLPSLAAGVFEVDARVQATGERTEVTLGQNRIRWVFERDGSVKAADNGTLKDTGARLVPGRWHHLRIAWKDGRWWARVDGARYPKTGAWNMRGRRGVVDAVKLANGARTAVASFDNLRAWPEGAQPAAMTTFDPVTLDAMAVTDANGYTVRYLRDGLRRVVQITDGAGRLTAQRDHRFSRGISATSAYNTSRPNRQTDIAYPSRDGHKDLSRDGHRTLVRGTALTEGITLEEGVSLETTGPYVVEAGETVDLKASVRIVLGPGFHAKAGSNFRAGIDARAGGDGVTGSGAVAYNQRKAAKRAVKLGPSSVLETGRVEGRVTARTDFHPGSATSGKTVILAFEDGGDYVRMVYENGRVKLESRIGGNAASTAMVPGYNRNWPWARVEMELLPAGRVNAWMYGHEDTRFRSASASVAVPANWKPAFKAAGESGDGYLANLYIGKAETVTTYYDGLARQIQTRAGAEADDIVTRTTYNRAGKPEKLLGPVYRSPSQFYSALAETAAGGRVTKTTYESDPLLRVSSVVPPGHDNNSAVDTRYGNWAAGSGPGRSYVTVDDEKGVATTRVYDPYGRMQHVIADSAGTSAGTRNNTTSFSYDALDRLVSTTMPGGGTTRYAYDTLGRMVSRHHPDADGATLYKYDDLGRMRFSQDARQRAAGTGANRKITYTVYDDFGRVTRVGEAAANFASLDPERSYAFERDATSWRSRMTYDGGDAVTDSDPVAGNGAASGGPNYAQGRLTRAQENTDADVAAEVVHEYAYDHLGNVRVKQVEIESLAGAKTATYAHDLAGRVTRLTYPDGAQARYAYDSAGRLSRVWDANGNTLAAYTHTAAGNIGTHVVGADIATGTYAYNPREWVTDIDYAGKFSSKLTYDLAGNVTRQVYSHGTAASRTADYAYDALYRITGFDLTGGTSRDYAYDRNGNLTSMVTGSSRLTYNYSAGSTPNRLDSTTGTGGQTYVYNRNGWMTRKGANTLTYDYRGLTTGYGTARYLMDPDRRRVKKTVGTAVTYYLRGPGGSVLAEYSGQTLSARYVYAGSRRIARISGSGASYYLADHLGSTRSLVDGESAVTAAYDYWPYGKVLASSGTGFTHFRFTGHERDAESGLDYMLARSYAYDVGRFLRPDPMQEHYPGISPYAYVSNNPLRFVDPTGAEHHEISFDPDVYLHNTAKQVAKYAADITKKAVEETIVFSDETKEVAENVAAIGIAGMALGGASLNTPMIKGSFDVIVLSMGIGTVADVSKLVALSVDALFFGGSEDAAIKQSSDTLTNLITGRVVRGGFEKLSNQSGVLKTGR